MVVAYHIRSRFFLDWTDVTARGIGPRLFYAATAFGHEAVIVFFVMSGFFISRIVVAIGICLQRSCRVEEATPIALSAVVSSGPVMI